MKTQLKYAGALIALAIFASAETKSGQTETVTINGKTITIKYSSPAVNGRVGKLFGKDGTIGQDQNYPVWRAGANNATAFHTDADLDMMGLAVPKGDYTLFVVIGSPDRWQLVVNKQTGQSGLEYDSTKDVGRINMHMSKPPAMVEQLKYTLSKAGGNKGKLDLAWENHVGSVDFAVK